MGSAKFETKVWVERNKKPHPKASVLDVTEPVLLDAWPSEFEDDDGILHDFITIRIGDTSILMTQDDFCSWANDILVAIQIEGAG